MAHRKVHRRYRIFPENYYQWIMSCLRAAKEEGRYSQLDDYEVKALRNSRKWTYTASFPEVATILTKLGYPITVTGFDVRAGRFTGYQLYTEYRKYFRKHKINETLDYIADHKFYVATSREFSKCFTLFSQLINSQVYVTNRDWIVFKKMLHRNNKTLTNGDNLTAADVDAMKVLCEIFANVFIDKDVNGLNSDDYAVLFLLSKFDAAPLSKKTIKDILGMKRWNNSGTRVINKLCHARYIELYGTKENQCYSLSERGWSSIRRAIDCYFKDVKVWKMIPAINQKSDIDNGTNTDQRKKEIAVA